MRIRNLDKIFRPKRVALIGACDDQTQTGYTVLRNMLEGGFKGISIHFRSMFKDVTHEMATRHC
ncbi:MAG: hypothetical protein D4R56_02980 [Deltaproteobacteria bacterium]|nr:MAG: hypothetical protein D4R56_02980 [Deltaproteobacteria bacterium]